MRAERAIAALLACALPACGGIEPKAPIEEKRGAKERLAKARQLKRACGSAETYDRLKAHAFGEAARISAGDAPMLDRIAASTTVRMEDPTAKSRDEALDVTVCQGRFVLDLPPGLRAAVERNGGPLAADIEYSVVPAASGDGTVLRVRNADVIFHRLAAIGARVRPADERSVTPMPAEDVAPPSIGAEATEVEEPVAVARPAFDCARARSRVEHLICADGRLARQDRYMSSEFYNALARADPTTRAALRASRDRFLRDRDRCPTAECVALTYENRVDEIRDLAGR